MSRLALLPLLTALTTPAAHAVGPPPSGDRLPAGAWHRLGTTRLRHGGLVRAVAFAPDGQRLASASHDGTVSVWAVPAGRELFRCSGHTAGVCCVSFSPDGQWLASGGADATVRLWQARGAQAGRLLHTFQFKGDAVEALAFAPSGKWLACGADDGAIHLLDPARKTTVRVMAQDRGIRCLAWSSDGRLLASNGAGKGVTVWGPARGAAFRFFGDEPAGCLAFAPKGQRLVSWEEGSLLRLWDADTGKPLRSWTAGDEAGQGGAGSQIYQIAFSPDGKRVYCGTLGGAVEVFDPENGKRQARWTGHAGRVTALAVAPGGKLVATGGADHSVRLWDAEKGKLVAGGGGLGPVVSMTALPGRVDQVAVVQATGEVRAWSKKGRSITPARAPRAVAVDAAFRPDGWLYLASEGRLRMFDPGTGRQSEWPVPASPITGLSLSGDGTRVATTHRDGRVTLSDAEGKKAVIAQGRERRIAPVLSPDGGTVAAVGPLATIPLWDGRTGEALPALAGHRGGALAAAFTPDGRVLVTGGHDRMARIWDVWTGKERRSPLEHPAWVCAAACSPAGVVATADVTGTIRLWTLDTGKLLATRIGHRGRVTGLTFMDGGRSLVSAGLDATVLFWEVTPVKTPRPALQPLTEARRDELWKSLLEPDPQAALKAMASLAGDPAKTAAFLRKHVNPSDDQTISRYIAQLDHEKFEVRDKAFKELSRLGTYARTPLRRALAQKPSLEKVRTIEKLLESLPDGRPTGERLRVLRAVEVLERIAGREGRVALAELAKSRNAELAHQAKSALSRIAP